MFGTLPIEVETIAHQNRIIVPVSHCLLNPNSKVLGSEISWSEILPLTRYLINEGAGLYQLPCPEQTYLGCNRWGQSKEQYDNPYYRDHCRIILKQVLNDLFEYNRNEYYIPCLLGIKGSPSCGTDHTFSAPWAGEILNVEAGQNPGSISPGSGVFMEEISVMLKNLNLSIPLVEVDEKDIEGTINKLKYYFTKLK